MEHGKHRYDDQTLDWLLESTNPSIRYRTLTELLAQNENDPDVIKARERAQHRLVVTRGDGLA